MFGMGGIRGARTVTCGTRSGRTYMRVIRVMGIAEDGNGLYMPDYLVTAVQIKFYRYHEVRNGWRVNTVRVENSHF